MTIVPASKIGDALRAAGCPEDRIFLPDSSYAMLTTDGVKRFGKRFASFLWRAGLDYGEDRWDCDNFAKAAAYYASEDWARWEKVDAAMAFGEMWYVGKEGGHAINWAAHPKNEEIEICCYEPQVGWGEGPTQVSMRPVPLSEVSLWLFCSC